MKSIMIIITILNGNDNNYNYKYESIILLKNNINFILFSNITKYLIRKHTIFDNNNEMYIIFDHFNRISIYIALLQKQTHTTLMIIVNIVKYGQIYNIYGI